MLPVYPSLRDQLVHPVCGCIEGTVNWQCVAGCDEDVATDHHDTNVAEVLARDYSLRSPMTAEDKLAARVMFAQDFTWLDSRGDTHDREATLALIGHHGFPWASLPGRDRVSGRKVTDEIVLLTASDEVVTGRKGARSSLWRSTGGTSDIREWKIVFHHSA